MSELGYYPGCSLSGGGIELDLSVRALAERAGLGLREIEDWNCCGASVAHAVNHELAVALPYRTLALAAGQGFDEVLAPCAACFSRLKGTAVRLGRDPALVARMADVTGRQYSRPVRVLNVIEFVDRLLSNYDLAAKLGHPLAGLKVAPYYGCLLSRGEGIVADDPEQPSAMVRAIHAAGAEPVEWNFATECCGAGFSLSKTEAVIGLGDAILSAAAEAGAEAILTGCPMCHSNLDMRQQTINAAGRGPHRMPVLYLTELLGLAAGLAPETLGLNRHFTDATGIRAGRS